MPEIFVATTGRARLNPVTQDVWLEFESKDMDEITVQLPLPNLQLLATQASEQSGRAQHSDTAQDPLPLGGRYRVIGQSVSRNGATVRLTTYLESATGQRTIVSDMTPKEAFELADDLHEHAGAG